jgi:predicted acyl esterase
MRFNGRGCGGNSGVESVMPDSKVGNGNTYGMAVERDVMVRVRDGVRLATDIYRPATDGKPASGAFPVILERTPYDKAAPSRSEMRVGDKHPFPRAAVAEYFVRDGYVVIYQD